MERRAYRARESDEESVYPRVCGGGGRGEGRPYFYRFSVPTSLFVHRFAPLLHQPGMGRGAVCVLFVDCVCLPMNLRVDYYWQRAAPMAERKPTQPSARSTPTPCLPPSRHSPSVPAPSPRKLRILLLLWTTTNTSSSSLF